MVVGMPGFQMMGTHLLSPWYEHRRRHRNDSLREAFRRHPDEAPQRRRRWRVRTIPSSSSLSPKGVHGLWVTMWMSDQYNDVPQHLTHCPIGRQCNPCNFREMQFCHASSSGTEAQIPMIWNVSLSSIVQKCAALQNRQTRLAGYH
jgi:hypothetical protein